MRWTFLSSFLFIGGAAAVFGQAGGAVKLTLQQAEALALQNHPQVLAAQNAASAMGQRVVQAKAPYYPVVAGDVTASGANQDARIGAGYLSDSRLFNHFGQGLNISQLITDSGRTSNLVASSKLRASASQQTYQATRYDVVLRVNQAYFNTLRAQATIKVAQQTVAARQLIVDQVTALANNNLRSQLDVTFVDVSLSQGEVAAPAGAGPGTGGFCGSYPGHRSPTERGLRTCRRTASAEPRRPMPRRWSLRR